MRREGMDFGEALKGAQQNGYAEADPTADVEGHDACRKIAILSSIAYNEFVDCNNIHTEGITKISLADMIYAEAMDSVIKLIGVSRKEGGKVFARVTPAIISREHPLANVEDVFNAIVVSGDAIGDAMFYGRGAGKLPTASAVIADIIDIAKHNECTSSVWQRKDGDNLVPFGESESAFFVRTAVRSKTEAARYIDSVFENVEYIKTENKDYDSELAFRTRKMTEAEFADCIGRLKGIASVKEIINVVRILE
jgi:homoserine dehydrogenase